MQRDESVDKDCLKIFRNPAKFLRVPRPDGDGDNRVVSPFVPITDNTDTALELVE